MLFSRMAKIIQAALDIVYYLCTNVGIYKIFSSLQLGAPQRRTRKKSCINFMLDNSSIRIIEYVFLIRHLVQSSVEITSTYFLGFLLLGFFQFVSFHSEIILDSLKLT